MALVAGTFSRGGSEQPHADRQPRRRAGEGLPAARPRASCGSGLSLGGGRQNRTHGLTDSVYSRRNPILPASLGVDTAGMVGAGTTPAPGLRLYAAAHSLAASWTDGN